jgi:hypothetical protein
MENSFQTSFIPKKPVVSSKINKTPKSLLLIILSFLLIVSVLASIGLFLYKNYLIKQKESYSTELSLVRESFEKDTIDELALFDKRTESAKGILNDHIVLSPVFVLLGEITIPSIQYTSFSHQNDENNFVVEIEGLAKDYRSIALQANMFNSEKSHSFENVLFYNLTKDKSNNINFSLKFNVKPALLSYQNNLLVEETDNTVVPANPLLDNIQNER